MRELTFEGVLNLRDFGDVATEDGRRVRPGLLFRSMSPQWMTSEDAAALRDELGLRVVIDLRGLNFTSGPLVDRAVRREPLDFFGGLRSSDAGPPASDEPEVVVPWLLRAARPQIAQAVELVASAGGPVLLHCHTGKDRTGIVAALLLGVLGVSDEEIVADFLRSARHFEAMFAMLEEVDSSIPETATRMALEPPNEAGIRAALAYVHGECGGFREYLLDAGVRESALDALAEAVLE